METQVLELRGNRPTVIDIPAAYIVDGTSEGGRQDIALIKIQTNLHNLPTVPRGEEKLLLLGE